MQGAPYGRKFTKRDIFERCEVVYGAREVIVWEIERGKSEIDKHWAGVENKWEETKEQIIL